MLEIDAVSIRFGDHPEAVSDTSFTVRDGEHLVVVGETGSGKSVLLLAILGLLPPSAQFGGRILLDGCDLLSCGEREMDRLRGTRMAYIPQGSGNGLNPLYTVGHQLCESLRKSDRCTRAEARNRAVDLLESFDLKNGSELCGRYPFQLSGGMRQRVLIAMGMATGASLLLADEPTKGLDSSRIARVEETFQRLGDRSLLCVTHDLRFAKAISSHIVVMYASQQIESGDSQRFFTRPLHPYSQAMFQALPENGLQTTMGFAPPRCDAAAQTACHFQDRCPFRSDRCQKAPPLFDRDGRKVRCWNYAD